MRLHWGTAALVAATGCTSDLAGLTSWCDDSDGYFSCDLEVAYDEAEEVCGSVEMTLATPDSLEEQELMAELGRGELWWIAGSYECSAQGRSGAHYPWDCADLLPFLCERPGALWSAN